jgi:hypothetical protein
MGAQLRVPVISKDTIKEALADISGETVSSRSLGALASETMWRLAGLITGRAIVESWWFGPRDLDFVRAGLATAGKPEFIELWCAVPPDLAWARYLARTRHSIHPAGQESRGPWDEWMDNPGPLGLGPVLSVNTAGPVDPVQLAGTIAEHSAAWRATAGEPPCAADRESGLVRNGEAPVPRRA